MTWMTLICGTLLILIGITSYMTGEPAPGKDTVSPTALIPAFFGIVLILCGALSFDGRFRKHTMHMAAMVGLLGALGGFMPIARQIANTGAFDPFTKSALAGEFMIVVCVVFVGMCVNSFLQARRSRQEAEGKPQLENIDQSGDNA
ncbi:MAG: hypothetical protein KF861_12300 [Planctomycetaceae bacterium]|nr:hypothetical protein [Planctomycetaceae bacterium]